MTAKNENRFLSKSRERETWRKKLGSPAKKEPKADAVYFRPNVADDQRIDELARLTNETKNAIVEKLVRCALHNKSFGTEKLEEQKKTFRRLEDKIDALTDENRELSNAVEELRRAQTKHNLFCGALLGEIYCMVHTAVSLLRVALLQILNFTNKQSVSESVLAAFDDTSDLIVQRSLADFGATMRYHRLKSETLADENLFWKSKLRPSQSDTESPNEQAQSVNQ